MVVPVVPGSSPALLEAAVERGARGVVVEGFGSGNLPQEGWPGAVRRALDAGVAVVVRSQCHRGRVDLSAYVGGRAALAAGAMSSGAMTAECSTVKLMHLLERTSGEELRGRYGVDVAGEGA
jgi:L-asparaginase